MTSRKFAVDNLTKISRPVLHSCSNGMLKQNMPIEQLSAGRERFSYLEAVGRTISGIAPWLCSQSSDNSENLLRAEFFDMTLLSIQSVTDPQSPDYSEIGPDYTKCRQFLVDAAFLAHGLVRRPALIEKMTDYQRKVVVEYLLKTRNILPGYNNWLLFSAMVEVGLFCLGTTCDDMRIDYAVRQHDRWYVGDGAYKDGEKFAWDYYNSFVIQPMLLDIVGARLDLFGEDFYEKIKRRAVRYARVLEMTISPDGTYPPVGRSTAYRCGAFQLLSQMALREQLPSGLKPAEVRCALQAVIEKTITPQSFDENGWLKVGICGSQQGLGEEYISTGSLYLCTTGFLHLGLNDDNELWTAQDAPWTQRKIWASDKVMADHKLENDL